MNFNLVSPSTNGNDYEVHFKDPITIDENSKVSLNWAELKRQGQIVLEDDASITYTSTKCLPSLKPSDNSANDLGIIIEIPKGRYDLDDFDAFVGGLLGKSLADTTSKFKLYEAATSLEQAEDEDEDDYSLQNDGRLGMIRVENITENPVGNTYKVFSFDATNQHDASQATGAGAAVAYTTANNNGIYDNYANSEFHYNFYKAFPEKSSPEHRYLNGTEVYLESIENINNQTGKIGFGLIGKEYTDGIGGAPPTRTNGNNPPQLDSAGIPKTYIWVDCGDSTGDLGIYYATNAAGGTEINTATSQNFEIGEMRLIHRIPMSTNFNIRDKMKLIFRMGLSEQKDEPEFVFQILNNQFGVPVMLYDSSQDRRNLPFKMTIGDGITYDNATAINSQIPFGFQASAQNQNQGWLRASFPVFDKGLAGNNDANPLSIIRNLSIDLSENLVAALTAPNNGIIRNLYPNGDIQTAVTLDTRLDLNWKAKNYSIFINLPCNNYKNIEEKRDGGFKKSILANIPSPFTTGNVVAQAGFDVGQVISIYQPYQPITSDLKNNQLQMNSFRIKIVDMLTEEPATHINRSIINFTVHK
jgi:hypothetical protein